MWFALTALVFFGGVALIVLGRRGTPIDNHRLCWKCRHDLFGSAHASRCPECGTDVATGPKIRGNRRRRPALIYGGFVLIVAAFLTTAVAAGIQWTGWDYWHHVPLSYVAREARSGDSAERSRAFAELNLRLISDPNHVSALIDSALEAQGDASAAWDQRWGDIVESAFAAHQTTPAQWDLYLHQAFHTTLRIRSRVRRGDPLPVAVLCSNYRRGNLNSQYELDVTLPANPGSFTITANHWRSFSDPDRGWENDDAMMFPGAAADGLPDGPQQLVLAALGRVSIKGVASTFRFSQSVSLAILPASQRSVSAYQGAVTQAEMERAIKGELGFVSGNDQALSVQASHLPVNVAFDVLISSTPEFHAGFIVCRANEDALFSFSALSSLTNLSSAEMVLRPSYDAAARTVDVEEIWDGVIRINKIYRWP